MGLFQLSFTVLLCYHAPCILRLGGRTPCSAKKLHLLICRRKTTKLPSENRGLIRYVFCVEFRVHCYRLLFARRYKTGSLLCFTAAKKMFQLAAFVGLLCNFSQNIVNFLIGSNLVAIVSF